MADDIKIQIAELERLTKEYEKLTKLSLPKPNIKSLGEAQAAVKAMADALEEAKDRAADLSEGFKGIEAELNGINAELGKSSSAISLSK